MTTQVKVTFNQNPHDWKVQVIGKQGETETVEATLTDAGQEHVATIWDGKDLIVREVRKAG